MWENKSWKIEKMPNTNNFYYLILTGEEGKAKLAIDQEELNDLVKLIGELGGPSNL